MRTLLLVLVGVVVATGSIALPHSALAASIPVLDNSFHIVPDAHDLDKSCLVGAPLSFGAVMSIIQGFMTASISFGILISVLIMVWAGILFIASSANPESRNSAKKMLGNAAIGILIILSAWLMVDFVMKTLYSATAGGTVKLGPWNSILEGGPACVTALNTLHLYNGSISVTNITASGGSDSSDLGSTSASATGDEAAVRKQLSDAGVAIWHNACAPGTSRGCTNVGGMRPATISQTIAVRNAVCGSNKSCIITLTGGSEPGHASGTYSHGNGYKVDIDDTASVNTVLNKLTHTSNRGGDNGGPIYTDSCGNQYVHESTHWDITVKTTCSL